jgi:hypothetical protein
VKIPPSTKFSDHSNSRALVYTYLNSVKVSFGIHVRKPQDYGSQYTIFASLEIYILKADVQLNLNPRFDNWE